MNGRQKKHTLKKRHAPLIVLGNTEEDKSGQNKTIARESVGKALYELLAVFSEIDISELQNSENTV